MGMERKEAVGPLMVVATLMLVGYAAYYFLIDQPGRTEDRAVLASSEDNRRFGEWAYIAHEKEIRPGERIKLIVIPSPHGDLLDTKCLVYTNDELKQVSMTCPDAMKEFLE